MNEKTTSSAPVTERRTALAFAAVMILAGFLLVFRLGERPLRNPDEGRYAQIAREMLQSGDFVEPRLYGLDYLRKPPLFYWLVAGSFRIFGFREWAARLVPALAGWLGVLVVYLFARRTFGRDTALFSALLISTNFWYVQTARYLVIDAVFSFWVVVSLFAFYLALREESGKNAFRALFYLGLGLAFLAKGPVALALTGSALLAYAAVTRSFRSVGAEVLRGARWGALLFMAVTLPWFLAIVRREPEFFAQFLWHEHVKRFVSADFEHQQPWFYYPLALTAMLLPWIFFVRPLRRAWGALRARPSGPGLYLLTVSVAIVAFYSLSRSKMPTYILPCLPMLAILIAHGWQQWIDSKPAFGRPEQIAAGLMALIGIGGIVGVPIYLHTRPNRYPPEVELQLQLLGAVVLVGAVVAARSIRRGQAKKLFYSVAALMGVVSLVFALPMETMNPWYSTKAFADELKHRLMERDEVFIFDHPGPFYDFAFYLGRPVKVVGLEGEFEGQTGDEHEIRNASVSREQFDRYLREGRPVYCLIRKSDFEAFDPVLRAGVQVLKQDSRKVLFASGTQNP